MNNTDARRTMHDARRIAFATLGCKTNWTDTEEVIQKCRTLGCEIVPFDGKADAYIVNTCTVTHEADRQSGQLIRRARRANPNAFIAAIGCLGETDGDTLRRGTGADAVFGTSDRELFLDFLRKRLGLGEISHEGIAGAQSRARAFLKIQDGCDKACAYCIVPKARGFVRSVPPDKLIESCLSLSRHHREIVLTGIDIGQYRSNGAGLFDLLAKLADIEWMPRIRISSIEPKMVNARLVELLKTGKICCHVHLSIQSASDSVLGSMGRGYGGKDVEEAVLKLTEAVEGIAVTGDVIAGFPGETTLDHVGTFSILEKLPIAGLHVFPYSERKNTRAAVLPGKILPAERTRRAEELRRLAAKKRKKFLAKLAGAGMDVIVTSKLADGDGFVGAFSDNAVNVLVPADVVKYGGIGRAKITQVDELKVRGIWDSQEKTKTA